MEQIYFSISEVSQRLGEPVSCIRFWSNSFPAQIKPHRNGKGNRLYTARDIEVLEQVKYLLKTKNMTIEGAAKQLEADGEKVGRSVKAIESLKNIREQLKEVRDLL